MTVGGGNELNLACDSRWPPDGVVFVPSARRAAATAAPMAAAAHREPARARVPCSTSRHARSLGWTDRPRDAAGDGCDVDAFASCKLPDVIRDQGPARHGGSSGPDRPPPREWLTLRAGSARSEKVTARRSGRRLKFDGAWRTCPGPPGRQPGRPNASAPGAAPGPVRSAAAGRWPRTPSTADTVASPCWGPERLRPRLKEGA
jgi:hypothetical protein